MFSLGRTVMTRGFIELFQNVPEDFRHFYASVEANKLTRKHVSGDWGLLGDEDKQANADAIKHGDRILSKYQVKGENVYVITEYDRSVTTLLLTEEY